jgi:hypothetical protein
VINFKSRLFFFFPKSFSNTGAEITTNGKLLVDCIRKYTSDRGSRFTLDTEENNEPVGIPPVEAIDVLNDFIQFGLYSNVDREVVRRDAGKVHWNKVIKDVLPFINKRKQPIYADLYIRKSNYSVDTDITRIHAAVIAQLDKIFGWYFTSNISGVAPELSGYELPYSREKCTALLSNELTSVFSDREIRLLKKLKKLLLENGLTSGSNNFFCGMAGFEHVWESMCSDCFGNEKEEYNKSLPYPAYRINEQIVTSKENRQRIDIAIGDSCNVAVIDAKYYDFRASKPSWGDLVKQFYYKHSLESVTSKAVTNYFVVPSTGEENMPSDAVVVHSDGETIDTNFGSIGIIYLDTQEVMSGYLRGDKTRYFRSKVLPKESMKSVA